jgi:hypothetical protein
MVLLRFVLAFVLLPYGYAARFSCHCFPLNCDSWTLLHNASLQSSLLLLLLLLLLPLTLLWFCVTCRIRFLPAFL